MQDCWSATNFPLFIERDYRGTALAWFDSLILLFIYLFFCWPLMHYKLLNCSHAWHFNSLLCWMKLWSYFLLSALHIHLTQTEKHTRAHTYGWSQLHCTTPWVSLTHTHTSPHLLRHLQMSSTVRTHAIIHTHTNQLLLLYPTNLGDQRLINKSSVMEEVTEQRNADMDSRQYWISLYHDPLVFAAQLW